jgi:pilus assembly protein Flp/PilA
VYTLRSGKEGPEQYSSPRSREKGVEQMLMMCLWIHYRVASFLYDEEGASAVEYGLLVGLIAVAIIVAVTFLGDTLKGLFETVNTKLKPTTP